MMPDRGKVIVGLESLRDICNAKSNMAIGNGKIAWAGHANTVDDAISMLKEQETVEPEVEDRTTIVRLILETEIAIAEKNYQNTVLVSLDALKEIIVLLKKHEWNLLTEDDDGIIHGLPGDDGQYLMTDGEDIWIDDYVNGVDDGIILDSGRDLREIKAWMYMPELQKQKGR